jgi:glycosyltransferase involved in cell wall biosynthesis
LKTEKIKILVDCHVFDKGFQGTRTYIHGLYTEAIKDQSKHFYLVSSNNKNLEAVFGSHDNVTYLQYNYKNAYLRLLFEIPYLIYKHKIDFAHFQYRVPPIKLCRYITTTHDVLFEDFPQDFPRLNRIESFINYKMSNRISDIIFTVSDYSKIQIEKHLKVSNVIVMPNGVDKVFFEDYDKNEIQTKVKQEFGFSEYLIYVSRWEPRKNHDLVLKAFVKLKLYENHHLVFIGNDTFKNKEYEAIYNGLSDEVKAKIVSFKHIGFSKLLLLLRGAKAAVYPSRAEGFGIPPLESVAARIPTICSNATAMSDFDFFGDYFFDPSSELDFEEKLSMVLANGDADIDSKRQKIKQRYNWIIAAEIYKDAINKIS